jgi:hypothetical protein
MKKTFTNLTALPLPFFNRESIAAYPAMTKLLKSLIKEQSIHSEQSMEDIH